VLASARAPTKEAAMLARAMRNAERRVNFTLPDLDSNQEPVD
jgi:hypothetical protein